MDNIITLDKLKNYKNQSLKIGILGGSFDPCHIGHFHIAKAALEKLGLDEVWFALSPQNPLKPPHLFSYNKRIEMLQILIEQESKFKILVIENELKTKFTADLFEYLTKELSDLEFSFIIGADLVHKIIEWEKFDRLIELTNIVIFSRSGYSMDVLNSKLYLTYSKINKVSFIEIDEIDISSTQIRKKLK